MGERLGGIDTDDMDEYEAELLEGLLRKPVDINSASLLKLRSCGLLSSYQIASLLDYRSRHGDVMTFEELAAVDGYGRETVCCLAPFVRLGSWSPPGSIPYDSHELDVSFRAALKPMLGDSGARQWSHAAKFRYVHAGNLSVSASASLPYTSARVSPSMYSANVTYDFSRIGAKVIAGDFNARFGQGLILWNGMSMSSISSFATLSRSPSGLTPAYSFTGSMAYRGMASEVTAGPFILSLMCALGKAGNKSDSYMMPAANLTLLTDMGQFGLTHYSVFDRTADFRPFIPDMKTALDWRLCLRGTDISTEIAYDWVSRKTAVLSGTCIPAGPLLRLHFHLHCYPYGYSTSHSGMFASRKSAAEAAALCGMELISDRKMKINGAEGFGSSTSRSILNIAADALRYPFTKAGEYSSDAQLRLFADWKYMLTGSFVLKVRNSMRLRNWDHRFRNDLRVDFAYLSSLVDAVVRLNSLMCDSYGHMSYMDVRLKGVSFSLAIRQGVFLIDDWDDRIYVYERDAPGTFNSPALYGRGLWTSIFLSWNFASWGKLYLRASGTSYPFMAEEKKKPGKAELKLQCVFDLL